MKMRQINSGRLRAIGFDEKARRLRVQLDDDTLLEYDNITLEMWRRLSSSTSPWSYYRDNIEEELHPRRVSAAAAAGKNPLDDLFR